jgi:hypothetical protein
MPQCPQCQKPLRELLRRCPSCQADLDLLVDYVSHLRGGLDRAVGLTKAGELGQAVWAYLEILEVDPDNAAAKKQVAQVATAVRQFDLASTGRQWTGPSRNGAAATGKRPPPTWLIYLGVAALVLAAFTVGYVLGGAGNYPDTNENPDNPPAPLKKDNQSLSGS